jgi:hypothetical protein
VLRLFFSAVYFQKKIQKVAWKSEEYKRKPHMDLLRGAISRCLFFSARFCGFNGLPAASFFLRRLGFAFFES